MKTELRGRLLDDVVRLRRAERKTTDSREIGAVRADLERILGGSVSISAAARLMGVSPGALSRWVDKGVLPTVLTPKGRREVPISSLADLHGRVAREREMGRRHALESVFRQDRERAERLSAGDLLEGETAAGDSHRRPELRSLAYHRAIARRLRRPMAEEALRLVEYWRQIGTLDPRYADAWEQILRGPLPDIRRLLREDSQEARDLRQNSPFAGLLSEAERREILDEIR